MTLLGAAHRLAERLKSDWLHIEPLAAWIVYVEWAFWIGILMINQVSGVYADSTADWLVASAARDGLSPYADLRDLAAQYDIAFVTPGFSEIGDAAWIHPRTPAALLLLQPMLLFGPLTAHRILVVASLALLAYMGSRHFGVLMGTRWSVGIFCAVLLVIAGPMLRGMQFGAWSSILAALIGAVWLSSRRGSQWLPGLLMGVVIGIRLFPALLIFPLWAMGRRGAVGIALSSAVVLNLVGLWFFSLSSASVLEGIASAGEVWVHLRGNASIVKPLFEVTGIPTAILVMFLSAIAVAYLWHLRSNGFGFDYLFAVALVAMLLISPLSWEHYDVILFPVLALLIGASAPRLLRIAAGLWLIAMTAGFMLRQPWEQAETLSAGLPGLLGRLLLLIALIVVAERRHSENDMAFFSSPIPAKQSS